MSRGINLLGVHYPVVMCYLVGPGSRSLYGKGPGGGRARASFSLSPEPSPIKGEGELAKSGACSVTS